MCKNTELQQPVEKQKEIGAATTAAAAAAAATATTNNPNDSSLSLSSSSSSSLPPSPRRSTSHVLLSLDSCSMTEEHPPRHPSILKTGMVILGGLVLSEWCWRMFLASIQEYHEILQEPVHRQILARHLGVDTASLLVLAGFGWQARHVVWDVVDEWWHQKAGSVKPAHYFDRLYKIHPQGIRIAIFFFWYQVKNTYDTLVWNDGSEYVFHHLFSLITAWVAIGPFFAHYYAIFYLALCEISTCVLCILANFDDDHGVPGLGEAFPTLKVVVGALFVFLFIVCRCIAWPIFAYYFFKDTQMAFKAVDEQLTPSRRNWLIFLCVSLSSLSVLQIAWLGQIFVIAQQELTKAGFLI